MSTKPGELQIDADLASGRHAELVGELEALVAEHPLRERLRCQLMLALYRSARQAEALDTYRRARRELSEQLGLEPSEDLKRLEQAILRQDSALDPVEDGPRLSLAKQVTAPGPSLLIVPSRLESVEALVRLAAPLAAAQQPRELIIARVVEKADLAAATAALAELRADLLADGVAARTAAFSSPAPAEDVVRLASRENVDLLLTDAGRLPLGGEVGRVLEQAACDVACSSKLAARSARGR